MASRQVRSPDKRSGRLFPAEGKPPGHQKGTWHAVYIRNTLPKLIRPHSTKSRKLPHMSQSPTNPTIFDVVNQAPMDLHRHQSPPRIILRRTFSRTTPNLPLAAYRIPWCDRITSRILKPNHLCGHYRRTMGQRTMEQSLVLSLNQRSPCQSAKLASCRWYSSSSTILWEQGEIPLDWRL